MIWPGLILHAFPGAALTKDLFLLLLRITNRPKLLSIKEVLPVPSLFNRQRFC